MKGPRRPLVALAAGLALASLAGACGFGEGGPSGCTKDGDCDKGEVCRASSCYRFTTNAAAPVDEGDGGDGGLGSLSVTMGKR